jgi:outer membrane lipoprotein LolB
MTSWKKRCAASCPDLDKFVKVRSQQAVIMFKRFSATAERPSRYLLRRGAWWFGLLLLSACATRPPAPPAERAAWQAHRAALETLTHWQVQGRVGVRAGDEGWNASFDWQQQDQEYRIRLRGPFGQGAVELHGNEQGVWLKQADRPAVFALDPETLLEKETGWWLPVSGLNFWLRGLPVPGGPSQYRWDEQGSLAHLEQKGWQIDYRSYRQAGAFRLPDRISIEGDALRVKFVIDAWQT